jgi:hypothetical protein
MKSVSGPGATPAVRGSRVEGTPMFRALPGPFRLAVCRTEFAVLSEGKDLFQGPTQHGRFRTPVVTPKAHLAFRCVSAFHAAAHRWIV